MPLDLLDNGKNLLLDGGHVMIPLVLMSLLMWALIFQKVLLFLEARRQEKSTEWCWNALKQGQFEGAFWQQAVMRHFAWLRENQHLDRENLLQLQRCRENQLDRHVRTILLLAGASPLLGLLGTVGGMITTFDVIAVFGTGNARAMAAGISEALITTQAGLVVAVPGLLMGAVLYRRAENTKERMRRFGLQLLQQALKKRV